MKPIIQVTELSKTYRNAHKKAVDTVSFSVREGEFFAFLGPNGAGKTTTISILTTTLSKTSGSVTIAGFDLEKETRRIREEVGIIFQKPSLDQNLSAEENVRFHACLYGMYAYRPAFSLMPREYKDRVMELAELVGIKDNFFRPVKKMSGGTRRKLEIIRSLIHRPNILFLDEPTQGLDALSRRNLWEYINRTRQEHGTTIFLTTHYLDEAENVDTVCIINQGKISFAGPPEQMKENLLRRELILDADDRPALENELKNMRVDYTIGKHIMIPSSSISAQSIIGGLKTNLTFLTTREPSLEDAYIKLLAHKEGDAA